MLSAAIAVGLLVLAANCRARPGFGDHDFGSSYIDEGLNADITEFPWQLALQYWNERTGNWTNGGIGGAVLLSPIYALTAASNFKSESFPPSSYRVLAGQADLEAFNGVPIPYGIARLKAIKKHEDFHVVVGLNNDWFYFNDIAILTLATPIYFDDVTIKYAKLPANNDDQFVGRTGIITGWGYTGYYDLPRPTHLKKASIGVIDTVRCEALLKPYYYGLDIADTQICVYDEDKKTGACSGDEGGPLNIKNGTGHVVAGIASFSIFHPNPGAEFCTGIYPSVYTRTSAYLDWIAVNTPRYPVVN